MGRYFLSFGGENRPAARALSSGLRASGVELFFDEEITYGAEWLERLERELSDADGFLALIGSGPVHGWSRAELDIAINRQVRNPSFRIIPFLLPGAGTSDLPAFLARFHAYESPIEPTKASQEDFATISLLLGLRQLLDKTSSPFPGLESFEESLTPYFFGRTREIDDLLRLVQARIKDNCRWLQLEGASGSGKSSLAKAGVVPAMRRAAPEVGLSAWSVGIMRPGTYPLRSLGQAIYLALRDRLTERWTLNKVASEFAESSTALASILRESTAPKVGCLLVIDQFEELFTVGDADRAASLQFAALLKTALDDIDTGFYLVTTIRSDFLDHFSKLPPLEEALGSRAIRYYTRSLSPSGLRAAIEGPSKAAGLQWEEGLVERLLGDALALSGGLPLVAHVLYALWATRQHNLLTHRSYDALGGVTGALTLSADAVVGRLPIEQQVLAQKALLCLVRTTNGVLYTSRNTTRAEMLASMGGGASAEAVLTYLSGGRISQVSGFTSSFMRLVTVTHDDAEDRVDLVHEALISKWPTFQGWVKDCSEDLKRRDALESATSAWVAAGKPRNDLPTGAQLDYLKHGKSYIAAARDFLDAASARAKHLRRVKQFACASVAAFFLVSYLVLCEVGMKVAGGRFVRLSLDECGISLFHPMASMKAIRSEASHSRRELLAVLLRRRRSDGKICSDYDLSLGSDAWATRQSIAALLACRECASNSEALTWSKTALRVAFDPHSMHLAHDGSNYGWERNEQLRVTMTEPVVWTKIAVAKAFVNPFLAKNIGRRPLRDWFASTEVIIDRYRSADGAALNSFPRQLDAHQFGMYSTITELLSSLEARASGIPGRGSDSAGDILKLSYWLSSHFDGDRSGWRASAGPKGDIINGLTLQAYSALLWAERDVGFVIPQKILASIPGELINASERSYGDPLEQIQYRTPYLNDDGATVQANEDVVLLWHPWAVQVAARWLERSGRQAHHGWRDRVIAQRALTHLIVDMGPEMRKSAKQTYTYTVAETLYAISLL